MCSAVQYVLLGTTDDGVVDASGKMQYKHFHFDSPDPCARFNMLCVRHHANQVLKTAEGVCDV